MNITNSLKQLAILTLVLGVVAGCASTKSKEDTAAKSATTPADTTNGKGGSGSYTVVRGDNLWNIAGKSSVYGDPYRWPLIYKANKSKISDADLIYPNQIFDINQSVSSADVSAAVRHAKTRGAWSVGAVEASDTSYLAN